MRGCVLYDLDGTIVDTNELIIETFDHVFRNHCALVVERDDLIPQMGLPLEDQFRYFTGRSDVTELIAAYRTYNLTRHDEMVALFPNVLEVVQRFAAEGFVQGVVTTKMRATTERALNMFGLSPYMKTIVTVEDVQHPKPHPEPVLKAMELLAARPEQTVMVGDSPFDMQSAKAAGAAAVAVAWSLKAEAVMRDAGADHVIADMKDLYPICGLGESRAER